MTLSANTIWEVNKETGASDNNGGGFVSSASGVDRSLAGSPHATLTAVGLVNATTTIIDVDSGDYTCTNDDIGNILQITGGTATAGFYEIKARSAQQWTLDRSVGLEGETVVGNMGGSLVSPGQMSALLTVDGMQAWVKNALYAITSTTPAVSGGLMHTLGSVFVVIRGYNSARGDLEGQLADTNKPIFQASSISSATICFAGSTSSNDETSFQGIKVDGNGNATITAFDSQSDIRHSFVTCHALDCSVGFSDGKAISCEADTCTTGFDCFAYFCVAHDGTTGFTLDDTGVFVGCVSWGNSGSQFVVPTRSTAIDCTADGESGGGDGFSISGSGALLICCVAVRCGVFGFDFGSQDRANRTTLVSCAGWMNSSGHKSDDPHSEVGFVIVTADPFVSVATNDYRPNNDSPGGAQLRAAGIGISTQTNNQDIGAVQHADPAGGGGVGNVGRGFLRGVA